MPDIPRGQPFTIIGVHDGVETVGYRLLLNGAIVQDRPVSDRQSDNTIAFPFPGGLTKGTYAVSAVAYNDEGASAPTELTLVITGQVPAPITSLTVI